MLHTSRADPESYSFMECASCDALKLTPVGDEESARVHVAMTGHTATASTVTSVTYRPAPTPVPAAG